MSEVPLLELVIDLRPKKTVILVNEGNRWWIEVTVKQRTDPDDPNSPVVAQNLTGYGIEAQWYPTDVPWDGAGAVAIPVSDRVDVEGKFTIGELEASPTGFWRLRFTDLDNRPIDKAEGRFVAD